MASRLKSILDLTLAELVRDQEQYLVQITYYQHGRAWLGEDIWFTTNITVTLMGVFKFVTKVGRTDTKPSEEMLLNLLCDNLEKKLGITRARYGEVKQPKRPAKRKQI